MSASPAAAIGFIALIILFWGAGSPPAVVTGVFLVYAPAYIAMLYVIDMIRFGKRDKA